MLNVGRFVCTPRTTGGTNLEHRPIVTFFTTTLSRGTEIGYLNSKTVTNVGCAVYCACIRSYRRRAHRHT